MKSRIFWTLPGKVLRSVVLFTGKNVIARNSHARIRNHESPLGGYGSVPSGGRITALRRGLSGLLALWTVLSVAAADASEQVYYFHNDHLGTPQAMSDAAGRKVWEAEYEPFGKATVNQDPDGDGQIVVNNLRFPGQYFDAETGLHYNYHRDYHPETGRYLQPDPDGIMEGTNHLYAYAQGNPLRWMDPLGLCSRECPDCPDGKWKGSIFFGLELWYGGGAEVYRVDWNCLSSNEICTASYFCFGGGAIAGVGVTLSGVCDACGAYCKSDLGAMSSGFTMATPYGAGASGSGSVQCKTGSLGVGYGAAYVTCVKIAGDCGN